MTAADCVFIVDDDLSARRGLTRLVRMAGHYVRECASAQEFLDALDPEISGCVVLDLRMRALSAEEIQAELQARRVHLPIIVVTADHDPEARRIAEMLKAVAFFQKPVDGKALLDAIDWALRSGGSARAPRSRADK